MEKSEKTISVDAARKLQDFWCDTRGKTIKKECGYVDCREFWYSIEELENYFAYIKQEAGENYENLGIRIYLGTYPPTEKRHDGLTTVFLAPTGKKVGTSGALGKSEVDEDDGGDGNIYDIDPLNKGGVGDPPLTY